MHFSQRQRFKALPRVNVGQFVGASAVAPARSARLRSQWCRFHRSGRVVVVSAIHELRQRGLTLPSRGRATACHAWPSFHSGPCASCRCAPLMSNVRALAADRAFALRLSLAIRAAAGEPIVVHYQASLSRHARPCAHQDTLQRRSELQAKCGASARLAQISFPVEPNRKVLPSSNRGPVCACLNGIGVKHEVQMPSVVSQSPSDPQVSAAAKGAVRGVFAKGFASFRNQRPNPSIEGTCNIRLRRLSPAPHVKR